MNYISWLWRNMRGIRWNAVARIVTGVTQVVLGLLMVWLSKRFIDETIRTGTADDVLWMVIWLVLTVVGGVVMSQAGFWLLRRVSVRPTPCACASSAASSAGSSTTAKHCIRGISPRAWQRISNR